MCLLINFTTSCCSLKNGLLSITHTRTFYVSISDRFLRPFKNDRQVFNTVEKKQFTRAVILERWTESECRWKKKYHMSYSEESGIR